MADNNLAVVSESSPTESELARRRLRQRWELASVLNFLHVFEPVIEINMKVSAEEIETAIITPNNLLAQLHIALLKGIPPVSKTLSGPDAWVTVLCKKLAMWWPWVAEGDIPLTAAKGEEISRYKGLDPTTRLLLLKALCEIRADQDDTVSYVNDALKDGTAVASFRKDTIGGDGNGTKYWYDGNAVTGYRLYKEVGKFESKTKVKSNGNIPTVIFEWETLATNLEEFRKVVNEFSASKGKLEVAVGKTIETDAIPILEKLYKKKERALKQQQRQEMLLNGFHSSGITRSCRNRRPVNYTFDDYDRTIKEAIQLTKRRKTIAEEQMQDEKHSDHEKTDKNASSGCSDRETELRNSSVDTHDSVVSDTESDEIHGGNDDNDDDYNSEKDNGATLSEKQMQTGRFAHKRFGSRWSTRLAGSSNHSVSETKSPSAKNRSRQRPTRNSALETAVVPDSEDGLSSDNAND
ncbi:DDT domain-containing protein DDR4 [Actinidia eriantha]|uniref:DDT domain-containing protein DDR4 n=1 Tax=Actinidia eriantha TaxID=165200 RepID=UPI0025894D04|nr:DDT domain-containing protein DDR4 [Actinidia eriantha]